jgi:molybdopterin-biosynthesis enzyme MoeA-like protein
MAGVPSIMRAMFDGLKGRLAGGKPMLSRTVSAFLGEGVIAKDLGLLQDRFPDLEIGSYPFFRQNRYGASFVLRGVDKERIDKAAAELADVVRRLGGEPMEGDPAA